MWVDEIDTADEGQLRAYWEAGKEGDEFERPYATYRSLEAHIVALREEPTSIEIVPLAARAEALPTLAAPDEDGFIGICEVSMPRLDNTHLAYIEVIVRPGHRRRGVGTALLEAGIQVARDRGRHTVICEVTMPFETPPRSAGSQFLDRHGFSIANLDIHRVLTLPVPADRLQALTEDAAPHHADYRLVSFTSPMPDDLVEGYCRLQAAFNSQAPLGDLDLEPEVWDAARVRANEARGERMGRELQGTVALDSTGNVVGLTDMFTNRHLPTVGWQSGTLVLPDHRGHRLGLAIKLANLDRFQQTFPDVTMIHSWNAEENGPMVAINDTLGFRPVEYSAEMQRRLG